MTETKLTRGRIVLGGGAAASPRGFGCHCSGPAYGTPYCLCELAQMRDEQQDDDYEYEDCKK